jgi:hypothetical protein
MGAGAARLCDPFGGRMRLGVGGGLPKQKPCALDLDSGSARSDLRAKRGGLEKVDCGLARKWRADGIRSGKNSLGRDRVGWWWWEEGVRYVPRRVVGTPPDF